MEGKRHAHCQFLGGFRLFDDQGEEIHFPVIKGAAIIAYLSVLGKDSATRSELTGLLWGDKPDATARTSLRQCLHQMRAKLGDFGHAFLTITPQSVGVDRSVLSSDIETLLDPKMVDKVSADAIADPDQFLVGFEDLDPVFSDWLHQTRTQLGDRIRAMLKTVIADSQATDAQRLSAAQRLNAADPSMESAARLLIEDAARQGDHVALLRVYQKLWDTLEEEWGEEPSDSLQRFVGQTRAKMNEGPAIAEASADSTAFRKYLTTLSLRLDRDKAASKILVTLRQSAEALIVKNGGTVVAAQDNQVTAVFGLLNYGENNAREGIETALKLRSSLSGDAALKVGVGIDTGYLLVSQTNGAESTPAITGAVLEKAQALAVSQAGFAINATARTMRGLLDFYRTEPSQARDSFSVLGSNAVTTTDTLRGKRAAFVGRAPFLAALWEVWVETVDTNSLQIASIQGDAGVGKTRLADEFLHRLRAEGVRTLRAQCNPYDRSAPMEPLMTLLGQDPDQSSLSEGSEIDGMVKQLCGALDDNPVVMFIDDWQWADDATRLALGRFVSVEAFSSVLLVLTSRNVPADEWLVANSHQIVVPNLTAREVVEKAELLLNRPVDRRLKQQILEKSGGNPLFLEEVCHALGRPQFGRDHGGIIAELPASVQGLFARRVEKLSADELDIVFAAAVHGDQIDPAVLEKVMSRPANAAAYQRLHDIDILIAAGDGKAIRFKHGLARDVVYNMIPDDKRRALHMAFATHLRTTANEEDLPRIAERLTFHYRGGGDLATASGFAELSGDKALDASALDQAFLYYGVALNLLDQLPLNDDIRKRWISIVCRWAVPTIYAPSYDHLPVLERAEALAAQMADRKFSAMIHYWLGYSYYMLGEHDKALDYLRSSRETAEELGNLKHAIEASAIEGCILGSVARYKEAEQKMRLALDAKDRFPGSGRRAPVTSVYTRANLALLLADQGKFDEAEQLMVDALHRVGRFEHEVESSILSFSSAIHVWRGDWKEALAVANRSRERSEKVSSSYLMGFSRCAWGYAHWRLHGGDVGIQLLSRNTQWMRARSMNMYRSILSGWLAEAMAESGRFKEAEAAYLDTMDRTAAGEIAGGPMACRASALCAISETRLEDAENRLTLAQEFANQRNAEHEIAANHLISARLSHAQRQLDQTRQKIEAAKEIYTRLGLTRRFEMARKVEAKLIGI